jgi:DUF4097 and DUF4098 domain-containing protein YvlB
MGTVALLTGLSGCIVADFGPQDRFHEDFHFSYPIQPKARIDVESFNGAIEIDSWDKNEVEIGGTKYGSTEEGMKSIKIDVHHTDTSLEVRAVKPSERTGNMGAKFVLHVPRSAELDRIVTSNAHIEVADVERAAHLKSSNGSIKVSGVHGDVDAHTSNASITAEALDGGVRLTTSNGSIHAEKLTGSLEADTSNSSIVAQLDRSPSTPVKLNTSNGSIDLTMSKPLQSDIKAETRNSSITVHLPSDISARVTADTSNSSISSDFEVSGEKDKHHLSGTIGSGGHNIELNTSNGRIRIAKGSGD